MRKQKAESSIEMRPEIRQNYRKAYAVSTFIKKPINFRGDYSIKEQLFLFLPFSNIEITAFEF